MSLYFDFQTAAGVTASWILILKETSPGRGCRPTI